MGRAGYWGSPLSRPFTRSLDCSPSHTCSRYVGRTARRLGVAQKRMAEVARAAKAKGSTRIEWSTGTENTAARALYEGLGADGSDKVYYVLEGAALNQLAAQPD